MAPIRQSVGLTQSQEPLIIGEDVFPGGPLGGRWHDDFLLTDVSTHVLVVYRDQLDRLRPDDVSYILTICFTFVTFGLYNT